MNTHLVCRRKDLADTLQRNGKMLAFNMLPNNQQSPEYIDFLHHTPTQWFQPLRRAAIETINAGGPPRSLYADVLRISFETMIEHQNDILYRRRS